MEKTRQYSGLFIIDPAKEEAQDEVLGSIRTIINDNKGNISEEKPSQKKKLSYPIMKKEEGIYVEMRFDALPASIEKINSLCKINVDILRTIITLDE